MNRLILLTVVVCGCSPSDVLSHQGQSLVRTDYVQEAIDKKKQDDAKAAAAQAEVDQHVRQAQAHLDLLEYEAAVKEYKEAYRLSSDPKLLAKLAGAIRLTGDCMQASSFYSQYLDKVKEAPNRAAVAAKLAEAKKCEKNAGGNIDAIRKHYSDGAVHYQLEEWDKAIAEFKEAFRLSNDPIYLFNIAQSYRLSRNCKEAESFYKKYLNAAPDADDKDKILAKINDMHACAS